MKLKSAVKIESIITILVILATGLIIFSSTRSAFEKAKESKTRSEITNLKGVLDSLVNSKTNLLIYLSDCNTDGVWCQTDEITESTLLVDSSKSPVPFFTKELRDATGRYLFFRATGKNSYLITGRSVSDESLCWIGSSAGGEDNLVSATASSCPE